VLQAVGERLARLTRNCDTLARIGGDEFALLRPVPGEREHLLETARDIELALGEPVTVGTTVVEVRASIGIAVAPADGECGKALLEAADVALYRAKRDGTGVALAAAA
jgi:diguanylate cyclase (GGDEF)-like protein